MSSPYAKFDRVLKIPGFFEGQPVRFWSALVFILFFAVWLRLWGLSSHAPVIFEGHESNYLLLFEHLQQPGSGDTASYPTIQWWWYAMGFIFPQTNLFALFISIGCGVLSIFFLAHSITLFSRSSLSGLLMALLLSTHPLHVAWSTSVYNVITPFLFWSMAFYFAIINRTSTLWLCLSGLAVGLAISMRVESVVLIGVWFGFVYFTRRSLVKLLLPTVFSMIPIFFLCLPALRSSTIPGSGEHLLAFQMNLFIDDYWYPYSGVILMAGGFLVAAFQNKRFRWAIISAVVYLFVHHLLMSCFNDYGSRHVLPALVVLMAVIALARPWWLSLLAVFFLHLPGYVDLQQKYHAQPEKFNAWLKNQYHDLPVLPFDEASCLVVNENPPFAQSPPLSHFNLWDPSEFEKLERIHGCVEWCMDINDWRWSSLGIHDRARRIEALYMTDVQKVLQKNDHHCVLFGLSR